MAEYPGAARAAVSPNRSPRQGRVQLFIVHHYAGTQDPESAWRRFNAANDRSVSPNYQVNADGSVFEVVPPDCFRAWTTGTIDHQAVTCETQNTSGAPAWGISRESHEAIAHLIAWASRRYGFPIQRGAVADGNRVTRPGVVGHRETPAGRQTSTACPGPSMDLDWLVDRASQIAGGSPASVDSTPLKGWDEMATKDEIRAVVREEVTLLAGMNEKLDQTIIPVLGRIEVTGLGTLERIDDSILPTLTRESIRAEVLGEVVRSLSVGEGNPAEIEAAIERGVDKALEGLTFVARAK